MKKDPSVYKFLKSIAGTNPDSDGVRYIRSYVKKDPDWHYIYQQAYSEGLSGLLFYHLDKLELLECLPVLIRKKIESTYKGILKVNLNYLGYLLIIEDMLKSNNVNVLVLQGISLLKMYGDSGLRPMTDMDILVKPEDKKILLNSLKKAGFYAPFPGNPYLVIKNNLLLDIHTHPLNIDRISSRKNLFPEDITGFWERARSFSGFDSVLLVMDNYDSYLCLSAHALKHCYSKIIWLCDLNELLREILKDKNGWDILVDRAYLYEQRRILAYSLMMIELFYGIDIPGQVKKELNFKKINPIERRILWLASCGTKFETASIILSIFNIKGVVNKFRFLKESVFPRKEVMAMMVNRRSAKMKLKDYHNRMFYTIGRVLKDLARFLKGLII